MPNAEPTDDDVFDLLREIHQKLTNDGDPYVSILYPEPGPTHDERSREIRINQPKLSRVGE